MTLKQYLSNGPPVHNSLRNYVEFHKKCGKFASSLAHSLATHRCYKESNTSPGRLLFSFVYCRMCVSSISVVGEKMGETEMWNVARAHCTTWCVWNSTRLPPHSLGIRANLGPFSHTSDPTPFFGAPRTRGASSGLRGPVLNVVKVAAAFWACTNLFPTTSSVALHFFFVRFARQTRESRLTALTFRANCT